jgi:ATP-binding cassette, subfamily C (CFTR/MRP), member 4
VSHVAGNTTKGDNLET